MTLTPMRGASDMRAVHRKVASAEELQRALESHGLAALVQTLGDRVATFPQAREYAAVEALTRAYGAFMAHRIVCAHRAPAVRIEGHIFDGAVGRACRSKPETRRTTRRRTRRARPAISWRRFWRWGGAASGMGMHPARGRAGPAVWVNSGRGQPVTRLTGAQGGG
jgi:hypothetical protein